MDSAARKIAFQIRPSSKRTSARFRFCTFTIRFWTDIAARSITFVLSFVAHFVLHFACRAAVLPDRHSAFLTAIVLLTKAVDEGGFLKDMFSSSYSEFLLDFGTEQLMATLDV